MSRHLHAIGRGALVALVLAGLALLYFQARDRWNT